MVGKNSQVMRTESVSKNEDLVIWSGLILLCLWLVTVTCLLATSLAESGTMKRFIGNLGVASHRQKTR